MIFAGRQEGWRFRLHRDIGSRRLPGCAIGLPPSTLTFHAGFNAARALYRASPRAMRRRTSLPAPTQDERLSPRRQAGSMSTISPVRGSTTTIWSPTRKNS